MKGSIHVIVQNNRIKYEFSIRRNITIIKGDSATGKTSLIEMIRDYNLQGAESGVELSCAKPCVVVEGNMWKYMDLDILTHHCCYLPECRLPVLRED